MEPVRRWRPRLAAATAATAMAATVTLWLLPATAWAHGGPTPALFGDELARRPRRGSSGLLSCCCLIVVLVILLVVLLIRRRRQPPPPPPPPPQQSRPHP